MREQVFVHRPGDPWEAEARLRVGDVLSLRLLPAGGYRWSAVDTSDPLTAGAQPAPPDADGAVRAEITALRAGTAVLSATTSHTGDRFGPPTRAWRMIVVVVP